MSCVETKLPDYAFVVDDYKDKIKYISCHKSPQTNLNSKNNAEMNAKIVFRSANKAIGTSGLATCGAIIFRLIYNSQVVAHSIAHDSMFFSDECNISKNGIRTSCLNKLDCIKDNLQATLDKFVKSNLPSEISRIDVIIIGGATYEIVTEASNMNDTVKKATLEKEFLKSIIDANPKMRLAAYIPYLNERTSEDDTASVTVKVTNETIMIIKEDY